MRYLNQLISVFCVCVIAIPVSADKAPESQNKNIDDKNSYKQIRVSISADLHHYNKRDPKQGERSKIIFTPSGVKVWSNDTGYQSTTVFLQNFPKNKTWMLDKQRKIFSEILESEERFEQDSTSGLMSTKPCFFTDAEGATKRLKQNQTINGQKISVWECNVNGSLKMDYFNESLGLVIKEENKNLDVSELKNVKKVEFTEAYFNPPVSYTEVSNEEFFVGAAPLQTFSETE